MNKIENYLGIANHDIQVADNSDELKSYVASLLCEIDKLQQENKHLEKCYCNRTDCSGRIKDGKKYESLQQKYDKLIDRYCNIQEKYHKQNDNWNKLKEFINKRNETLFWTNTYDSILDKMQELEQGSDNNDTNR